MYMSVYSVLCLFCIHLVQLNTIKIHTYSVHIIVLILLYNYFTILYYTKVLRCPDSKPEARQQLQAALVSQCFSIDYTTVVCIIILVLLYKSLFTY